MILMQMEQGLKGEEGGLMMLPSFVDVFPTGCVPLVPVVVVAAS